VDQIGAPIVVVIGEIDPHESFIVSDVSSGNPPIVCVLKPAVLAPGRSCSNVCTSSSGLGVW